MVPAPGAEELSQDICRIEEGGRTFIIIGTAHVSKHSVLDVERTLEAERPDTVAIELCRPRYESILNSDRLQEMNIFTVLRQGKGTLVLANLLLASFQKRIGDKLGIRPGAEMIRAAEIAREQGHELVLADRDVQATLKRAWAGLGLWQRARLISSVFGGMFSDTEIQAEELEKMKRGDVLTSLLQEMGQTFPTLMQVLIHERDLYLMDSIRSAPGDKVVAVVGAGHVPGIRAHWGETVDRRALEQIPSPGYVFTLLKWLLPALLIATMIYAFTQGEVGWDLFKAWFLIKGSLAALGALVALGHPLAIVAAFLAAPFTSMIPLIGAGWVSGLIEAWLRKPTVRDLSNMGKDIGSLKGFYANRFTRVLLVAALSNLGSALGTPVAIAFGIEIFRQSGS